jgi:ankyrin repeat protein
LTALLVAIGSGHFELASFLLDRGADANAAPQGWTALHQLTWVRKTGVAGSNNPPPQGSGNMDSLELARRLVAHGADLNARVTKRPPAGVSGLNFLGGTPFLLAARTADAEYMRLLATLGADPRLPNKDNSTPLIVAAGLGTYAPGEDPGTEPEVLEAVKVALELGNDINAIDDHGQTVMHGAAYKHVPSVVEYLARAGAKIEVWNHMNADGRTPLDITIGVPSSMSIIRSPITEDAFRRVMIAAGVTPPPHYNPKY